MLFRLDVEGVEIPIQVVKRGKTVYYRIAPFLLHDTTEKQRKVRNTLGTASSEKFGSPLPEIHKNVAESFEDWYENNPPEHKINALEEALATYFGQQDVDTVRQFYADSKNPTADARYIRRKEKKKVGLTYVPLEIHPITINEQPVPQQTLSRQTK